MVRYLILGSCRPDDKYLLSVRDERKLTEEGDFHVEKVMLWYWVESLVRYVRWYEEACCDFTLPLEKLLDPSAGCLRPDRKDLLSKFKKEGPLVVEQQEILQWVSLSVHKRVEFTSLLIG